MTMPTLNRAAPRDPRQDRKTRFLWIALNWVGLIAGFGYDVVHAAVFGLWLCVQTAQMTAAPRSRPAGLLRALVSRTCPA